MLAPAAALALALAAAAGLRPLQPLVDAAPAGAVLAPEPGVWAGPVVISRPLTLDGRGRLVLDGQGRGTVLTVRASGVTVRGVRLTGSGSSHDALDAALSVEADDVTVEDNVLDDVLFGVSLKAARRARVCGNSIRSRDDEPGLRGDGVRAWEGGDHLIYGNDLERVRDLTLANTQGNRVEGNRVHGARYGLQLVFAPNNVLEGNLLDSNLTGVAVLYSEGVQVRRNRIQHSYGPAGACLAFKESGQAVVEGNAVVHCATGAKLNAPTTVLAGVTFRNNLFAHNVEGINFYGENGGHVLEGNRFEHNLSSVTVSAPMSARGHRWAGNAWDEYLGFDRDGDGVGDWPHEEWLFADRIFLEEPKATFFRNAPVLELLDLLERLAPFAAPELVLRDERPRFSLGPLEGLPDAARFRRRCPSEARSSR